jgi:hypothetical protein
LKNKPPGLRVTAPAETKKDIGGCSATANTQKKEKKNESSKVESQNGRKVWG